MRKWMFQTIVFGFLFIPNFNLQGQYTLKIRKPKTDTVQKNTIAKIILTNGLNNGTDMTTILLDQKAYTDFYTVGNDGLIYMANCWPECNTKSYGSMHTSKKRAYNKIYETYKADFFYFMWDYINSYNSIKGRAEVQIIKIYKPQAVVCVLKILPENLDVIIYRGNMKEKIDFSKFH